MKRVDRKAPATMGSLGQESTTEPSRREFLGGLGALSLAGLGSAIVTKPAEGAALPAQVAAPFASVAGLNLTRHEVFSIPGGREGFTEWMTNGPDGMVKKFLVHHSRVDTEATYTTNTNIRVHSYEQGASLDGKPSSLRQQNISINGIKGDVIGNVRNDHTTITTVHANGTTSRTTQIVPVRLDLSDIDAMDIATAISTMGKRALSGHQ